MMLYPPDTEPNAQVRRMSWRDLALVVRYAAQPPRMRLGWLEAWCLPCYTHRSALLLHCCRSWESKRKRVEHSQAHYLHDGSIDNEGWFGALAAVAKDRAGHARRITESRSQYREALSRSQINVRIDQALHDLLKRCRQENIPGLLFRMPESPAFREEYGPAVQLLMDEYLARLSQEQGVPEVDASAWLEEEAFHDGHHLLLPGAIRFTQHFGTEVLQPFLVGQAPLPNHMTEKAVTANHVSRDKNARRWLVQESAAGHAAKH